MEVIKNEFPVGTHLGSLTAVAARYGISVPTLRKALTLLQEDGIVISREGRTGGLVVASPPADTAVQAMYDFFRGLRVTPGQLKEARDLIDVVLAERACHFVDGAFLANVERIFSESRREGADLRQAIREFDSIILGAARQPVFALMSLVIGLLEVDCEEPTDRDLAHEWRLRFNCSRSIVAGNLADAISFRRMLRAFPEGGEKRKRAERLGDRVVDAIKALIRDRGLKPGNELGREGELQELLGVGQITLRDALRPLERTGQIQIVQGRKGGIFVGAAEPYAAIEMVSLYLTSINLSFSDQVESRQVLEPRAAWLAAERIDADQAQRLLAAVAEEVSALEAGADDIVEKSLRVERLIAHASGNPLIEFFTLVHIEFSMIQARTQEERLSGVRNHLLALVSAHHRRISAEIVGRFQAKAAFAAREFIKELGAVVNEALLRSPK